MGDRIAACSIRLARKPRSRRGHRSSQSRTPHTSAVHQFMALASEPETYLPLDVQAIPILPASHAFPLENHAIRSARDSRSKRTSPAPENHKRRDKTSSTLYAGQRNVLVRANACLTSSSKPRRDAASSTSGSTALSCPTNPATLRSSQSDSTSPPAPPATRPPLPPPKLLLPMHHRPRAGDQKNKQPKHEGLSATKQRARVLEPPSK